MREKAMFCAYLCTYVHTYGRCGVSVTHAYILEVWGEREKVCMYVCT